MTSLSLLLGMVWGLLLGGFYFGGLWLTVKRISSVGRPHLLLLTSFLARGSVVAVGFWFMLQHDFLQCISALVFFLLPRLIIAAYLSQAGRRGGKYANQP